MGNQKWLYCASCLEGFLSDNPSQTKCRNCMEKEVQSKEQDAGSIFKVPCWSCGSAGRFHLVGPYHGKHFLKCHECGFFNSLARFPEYSKNFYVYEVA